MSLISRLRGSMRLSSGNPPSNTIQGGSGADALARTAVQLPPQAQVQVWNGKVRKDGEKEAEERVERAEKRTENANGAGAGEGGGGVRLTELKAEVEHGKDVDADADGLARGSIVRAMQASGLDVRQSLVEIPVLYTDCDRCEWRVFFFFGWIFCAPNALRER